MCQGFHHHFVDPNGKEIPASVSLSRGAIGLGAAFSTMALLARKKDMDIHMEYADIPTIRLSYFLLAFIVFMLQKNYKGSLQGTIRSISRYLSNISSKSAIPCGNLKKSFSSAEALSRLSRVSSSETMKKLSSTIRNTLKSYRRRAALKAITRKECFAKLDYIGKLSIHDLIALFRYANDVNQVDFNRKKFMVEQNQVLRSVVTAVDVAVAMSRGGQKQKSMFHTQRRHGEVDALYFTAVMRVFAEWRSIRLVPNGYNRYAMGLNLAYRDILQNLAKIEDGVHAYMKHHSIAHDDDTPICPTLRDVLEFEIETGVHRNLPLLKERSAASGVLWSKRQLHYQTALFANTLQVPYTFATTQAGFLAAYSEVYDLYHGWAIKQIFSQSFGGSPPLNEIFLQMHPPDCQHHEDNNHDCGRSHSSFSNSEEGEGLDNEFLAAIESFGKQMARKWDDLLRFFNCVDDDDERQNTHNLIMSSESYLDMTNFGGSYLSVLQECPSQDSGESPIASDPLEEVKLGLSEFVNETRPLIDDVSKLIEEFKMNDPSRV